MLHLALCPACFAKDGAIGAIGNGIGSVVLTTTEIPDHDVLTVFAYAGLKRMRVVRPDTPGLVSPGECKVGVHPNRVLENHRDCLQPRAVPYPMRSAGH